MTGTVQTSARSWVVWGAAVFAYLVAVMHRSSLGVAAVDATERFGISASVLSSLAVVQLIVYAGLQVPVGVLLDRLGPRTLIASGALLMATGQLTVAFAVDVEVAVIGRILIGAGDACTFISALRLVPSWFSVRFVPQVSQWTGNIGQLGQLLSAVPLVWVLHDFGWTPAYGLAAALGLAAGLIVLAFVRDRPPGTARSDARESWRDTFGNTVEALRRPGTQLGFWSHFTTQASGNMFALLWGYPFMVVGLGYSPAAAAALLSLFILAAVLIGPILGLLSAQFPLRRSSLVLGIVALTIAAWLIVLASPEPPQHWMLVLLVCVLGIGGPGSLIGFDFARTFNPPRVQGAATGIVNVGGFVACLTMMFLVGVVLDLVTPQSGASMYTWEAFRLAFAAQFVVHILGVAWILRSRARTRRRLQEDEGITVGPLWVAISRALRRRRNH